MQQRNTYIVSTAMIVALGGFLMGFDASVISGVIRFIEVEFELSKLQIGWSVSSLTLTATLAMMVAGPLSDRLGRKRVLKIAAIVYAVSAVGSALAPNFTLLVLARMLGGFGVGASLIIAPMYIAEISPAKLRGQMVSFNQLNIVLGISVAFFSNYFILRMAESDQAWVSSLGLDAYSWRWMLGVEALPAVLYFFALFLVPRSPRWLCMKEEYDEALAIMKKTSGEEDALQELETIKNNLRAAPAVEKGSPGTLFKPAFRLVLMIGVVIGVLQQITGINAVFFYAPVIFEQSGIGTDAAFAQAILVGIINLVFTIVAMLFIDKLGRKPLLIAGVSGIALCMSLLGYHFYRAEYRLEAADLSSLSAEIDREKLQGLTDQTYASDVLFKQALRENLGETDAALWESELIAAAINMNARMVLLAILGFVASFAVSLGPVMWVLFSELFPTRIRGLAISFAGFINSGVSFVVQLVFPWELANLGSAGTFLIYGGFALAGLVFVLLYVPETRGKSLEDLEKLLVKQ
jgi:MFS transporter, SP family, arabinose:H+ symporter